MSKPDLQELPLATKLRIPRGGWPSGFSEFVIGDEPRRFRYVIGKQDSLHEPGKRRLHARIEGKRGQARGLFEELPDRPR